MREGKLESESGESAPKLQKAELAVAISVVFLEQVDQILRLHALQQLLAHLGLSARVLMQHDSLPYSPRPTSATAATATPHAHQNTYRNQRYERWIPLLRCQNNSPLLRTCSSILFWRATTTSIRRRSSHTFAKLSPTIVILRESKA